ncbi:hypothetical protein [Estrella lausannensis]|uniref:Uncharacterized protein n=1 Tax=Estrella lausannensis TaxID=483423 RepID=A0A0H5DN33_9BACT|nr:hypothetical protein [Estrella lausannensis]CRX37641.1 hypothetical protein ELAC_0280 [Estrella lausannensis]
MGNNFVHVPAYPNHAVPPNTPVLPALIERAEPIVQVHVRYPSKKQSCRHASLQQEKNNSLTYKTHTRAIRTIHQPQQTEIQAPTAREANRATRCKKEGMGLEERIQKMRLKMDRKEQNKELYLLRKKEREAKFNMFTLN